MGACVPAGAAGQSEAAQFGIDGGLVGRGDGRVGPCSVGSGEVADLKLEGIERLCRLDRRRGCCRGRSIWRRRRAGCRRRGRGGAGGRRR